MQHFRFVKVELDGRELVKDKDYTVKAGSIIVTLNPDLIKNYRRVSML